MPSPQLRKREQATQSVLQTEADMIKAIREAGATEYISRADQCPCGLRTGGE